MTPDRPSFVSDRREALLASATKLFFTRPFDEVTTTEIARSAGVAYGLIAHHFGNKRGIYLAVVESAAEKIRATKTVLRPGEDPQVVLRAGLRKHIAVIDENVEMYLALMRGGIGADPDVRRIIDDVQWEIGRRILEAAGVADEPPALLRHAMRGWVALVGQLIVDRIERQDVAVDDLVEIAVAALNAAMAEAGARMAG